LELCNACTTCTSREATQLSARQTRVSAVIDNRIKAAYGFVADSTKSRRHNLFILVAKQLSRIFFSRSTNLSCHNICSILSPPPLYRTPLGLGLNFCPLPLQITGKKAINQTVDRFRKDIHTKISFADFPNDDWINSKRLFIRSDWSPDSDTIPIESRARVSCFLGRLQMLTNLTPYQTTLLEGLRDSDERHSWRMGRHGELRVL
jgi:hypothetical protein